MTLAMSDYELLKAALETVREAVLITDNQLDRPGPYIVYANPAFCKLSGYTIEQLAGQTPRLLQGPETDAGLMRTLRQQLLAGEEFSGETINYRKDGSSFRMQWKIRPFPATGQPRYFIAAQRDVSVMRNLEQQRQQLQALVEIQTQVGTAGLDLQAMRDQVAEVAMAVTGADGAAVEEAEHGEMVYTASSGRAADSLGLRLPVAGSLSGSCYLQRESIHCRDTHHDPRVAKAAADKVGFRSGLLVPLTHKEQCFGVLKVYSAQPDAFSDDDLKLLNMASQLLASSLADARLFKGERDRRTLLVDSLPILISFVDQQLYYREINVAYTRWYNRPIEQIVGKQVAEVMGQTQFEDIQHYMLSALSGERVTFEYHLLQADGAAKPVEIEYTPLRSTKGEVQGFYEMIRDISDRKHAEQDYLTGAFNRKGFDDRLEMVCTTARRYRRPLALIFLDVDHFKRINDTFGHGIGDDVLRALVKALLNEVRDSDIVSRWGGEEFAVLAPETTMSEALDLAERLRLALSKHQFDIVGQITASFAVGEFDHQETGNDFMRRVDAALYDAKAGGRNRVARAN
ncbi:PAS domain S-box-containing protein/diguanylate cyclase (GGDEF) domain-containing protein [Arsukibacterium tuosuense]|uniref:PAS domain S-box-containing protein/diguanylate cyclase (GGDEF) domain-containing protein n=1 Tax=Arsukibacterium tuosuense TaxID=1323745 RepID=A0A285J8K7_9GAMM|nr:diguanylate cyclase [Arsukibacterium tuosuense]SNY56649.1 PAS domain S-box-containing protein/diguanylate cyclase (GGDEF) domain-containing protein [Arsukibacterium tuosuense]